METPQVVTCPNCQSEWPWEYNLCPIDGRSFRQIKRRIQAPSPQKPCYIVANLDHVPCLLAMVLGQDWEKRLDKSQVTAEWLTRWLGGFSPSWQKPIVLFFGLNDGQRRTVREIGLILRIEDEQEIREKLKHALWSFKPPLKKRPLIEFAPEDASFE